MSYKLDVSFKNCEKLDVIDKINEFAKLVKDNALDIIKENVRYNLYSLRSFYEETKDVRRLKDEIDKILNDIFTYHIYYSEKIKSLCICYGGDVKAICDWFDGYVYFQNSCDQDYDYKEWQFNDVFKQHISDVKFCDRQQLIDLYNKLNECDDFTIEDVEDEKRFNYYKRSTVYDLCYKDISPIWNSDFIIVVGKDGMLGFYDYRNMFIRILLGQESLDKPLDKEMVEYWNKVFKY